MKLCTVGYVFFLNVVFSSHVIDCVETLAQDTEHWTQDPQYNNRFVSTEAEFQEAVLDETVNLISFTRTISVNREARLWEDPLVLKRNLTLTSHAETDCGSRVALRLPSSHELVRFKIYRRGTGVLYIAKWVALTFRDIDIYAETEMWGALPSVVTQAIIPVILKGVEMYEGSYLAPSEPWDPSNPGAFELILHNSNWYSNCAGFSSSALGYLFMSTPDLVQTHAGDPRSFVKVNEVDEVVGHNVNIRIGLDRYIRGIGSFTLYCSPGAFPHSHLDSTRFGSSETCYHPYNAHQTYLGQINTTGSGKPCREWKEALSDLSPEVGLEYPKYGLEGNYCRQLARELAPDPSTKTPWCYVAEDSGEERTDCSVVDQPFDSGCAWEFCEVPICPHPCSCTDPVMDLSDLPIRANESRIFPPGYWDSDNCPDGPAAGASDDDDADDECMLISIGQGGPGKVSASVRPDFVCPKLVNNTNWLGPYWNHEVFITEKIGSVLHVTRLDNPTLAWTLRLEFYCCSSWNATGMHDPTRNATAMKMASLNAAETETEVVQVVPGVPFYNTMPPPDTQGNAVEAQEDDLSKSDLVTSVAFPVVAVTILMVVVGLFSYYYGKRRFGHLSSEATLDTYMDFQRKLNVSSSRPSEPSGEGHLPSQDQGMDGEKVLELSNITRVKKSTFDPGSTLADTLTSGADTEVHPVGVFSRSDSPEEMVQQANLHAGVMREGVQIEALIGKGAFGCVFKGVWNNVVVAVKVVEVVTGATPAHEMQREATLTKSLRHPNIIATFLTSMNHWLPVQVVFKNQARQMSHRQAIMVLEYGEGDLKSARLQGLLRDAAGAPLIPRLLNLLCDVANGMVYVHQQNIIHADLKPANIFYTWQLAHRTGQQSAAPAPSAQQSTAAPPPSPSPSSRLSPSPAQECLFASASARLEDAIPSSSGSSSGHRNKGRALAAVAAEAGVSGAPPSGDASGLPLVPGTMVDMVAKIGDFGLSRAFRGPPEDAAFSTAARGVATGTISHMAPEVMQGELPSPPGDVFAFGTVMWELYEHGDPYRDQGLGTKQAVVDMVLRDRRRLPFSARCPPAYRQLAERCWAHEPGERPSFAQVVQALADLRRSLC